jgi:hypothetical protein
MSEGKSLLGSKTFWINILGTLGCVFGSGIIPPKYSVPALGVINIANRVFTDQSITSLLPSGK